MKFAKQTLIVGLVLVSLAFSGCGKKEDSTSKTSDAMDKIKAINTVCPITGEPVDPEIATAKLGSKNVGFCCDDCVEKWKALGFEEQSQKLEDCMADH